MPRSLLDSPKSRHNHNLTLTEISQKSAANNDSWEGVLANLRQRYPGQKDSILFCIFKLHSNPKLGLPDFREEAALHGIPMAGRALHSAKVILGLSAVKPRKPKTPTARLEGGSKPTVATASGRARSNAKSQVNSVESKVLDAVRQIQSEAGAESERLRTAMQQAVTILQRALEK